MIIERIFSMKQDVWKYKHGIGIGGWLTNYKRFNVMADEWKMRLSPGDYEHFESYITERDVKYIASLGLDHVRVGFDQIVLEESPYVYRERTFRLLDNFIVWCKKYDLGCVLNLHKAVGNYCDVPSPVALLDDEELQKRFIAFWVECERRWHDEKDVVFELLNEVLNVPPEKWNDLADRTIRAIREKNPTRRIVIGSTCWNSPGTLKHLTVYDDPYIIYTYHFYAPHEFTHQQGVLSAPMLNWNSKMAYPDTIARYRACHAYLYNNQNAYPAYENMDFNALADMMSGAFQFRKDHPDKVLWLGEFGTIRHCKLEYRENWMHDVILLAKQHGISTCSWNYLSTPNDGNKFSLVDDDTRKILSPKLAAYITGKVRKKRK